MVDKHINAVWGFVAQAIQDTQMVFLLDAPPLECSNCALATSAATSWAITQASLSSLDV